MGVAFTDQLKCKNALKLFFICPYPKYQMPWRCLLNSTKSSTPSKRLHFFLTWIYSCSFSWVQSLFRSFFCKWGRLSKSYCGPILKRGISSLTFWIISLLISECLMNYFCINLSIMNFLNCLLDTYCKFASSSLVYYSIFD